MGRVADVLRTMEYGKAPERMPTAIPIGRIAGLRSGLPTTATQNGNTQRAPMAMPSAVTVPP